MRNFEERLAEIDRRSKKILKQRKQRRKQVLVVSAPLILCVSLSFVIFLQTETAPKGCPPEAIDNPTTAAAFSYTGSVDRIEVSGQEVFLSLTDPAEIQKITDQLRRCGVETVEPHSASGKVPDGDAANESITETTDATARGEWMPNGATSDSVITGYTLTLIISGEEPAEYYLFGNTLENCSTGEIHTFAQAQANVLYHLLGIPQP